MIDEARNIKLLEFHFRREITALLLTEIERRRLTPEDVAQLAGLHPSGAVGLMKRDAWPLSNAFRVAKGLKVRLAPSLENNAEVA